MDCLPVCQRGLPKKEGIRYTEHNSNMNEATVNKTDITVRYLRSYEPIATEPLQTDNLSGSRK